MKSALLRLVREVTRRASGLGLGRIPVVRWAHRVLGNALTPSGIVKISCQGHTLYINADDTGVAPSLLTKGAYEPFETQLLLEYLDTGMCYVNVGANIGYYAVLAARSVGETGAVYAFEPEPHNVELLRKNVFVNGYSFVEVVESAVGDREGTIELFLDESNRGNPSLGAGNVKGNAGSVSVPVIPLDVYLEKHGSPKVDVLQMDTQGSEGLVLAGAQKLLEQAHLTILMEFWPYGLREIGTDPRELLGMLTSHGFEVLRINEPERTLDAWSTEEIMSWCEGTKEGKGFVNLVVRK